MYRKIIEDLKKWKAGKNPKPLIIRGARQIGKTWLMKEFGRTAYGHTVYISFDNNGQMRNLFEGDFNIERLILGIELYSGGKIDPQNTLLIFDEIQEAPRALTSLKYFNENAPQYHIICAGSLLGVALHPGTSFPVGKVDFLDLHPLSYGEFLAALEQERFVKILEQGDFDMARNFKQTYIDLLKQYYFVGGMPEAVNAFREGRDFQEVRQIQEGILSAYEQDFSKHAPPILVPRLRQLWNNIPAQLARENKKFTYGLIKEGARAKEYELAMMWLCDCGLVHKINRISVPHIPLKAYEDQKAFKLFMVDLGLLSCLSHLKQETLLNGNELFIEFKGALTEQYVLQELLTRREFQINYWSSDQGSAEVDFILGDGGANPANALPGDIVPLEVKAEINLQAKSLKTYREKFSPRLSLRSSLADYRDDIASPQGRLMDIPLYGIGIAEIR